MQARSFKMLLLNAYYVVLANLKWIVLNLIELLSIETFIVAHNSTLIKYYFINFLHAKIVI